MLKYQRVTKLRANGPETCLFSEGKKKKQQQSKWFWNYISAVVVPDSIPTGVKQCSEGVCFLNTTCAAREGGGEGGADKQAKGSTFLNSCPYFNLFEIFALNSIDIVSL